MLGQAAFPFIFYGSLAFCFWRFTRLMSFALAIPASLIVALGIVALSILYTQR